MTLLGLLELCFLTWRCGHSFATGLSGDALVVKVSAPILHLRTVI